MWADTGTTILFVTHNIDEALRLGTRVVVLAKEGPDLGSRVALDMAVPDPCIEDEIPMLMRRLEHGVLVGQAGGARSREHESVFPATAVTAEREARRTGCN